MATNPSRTKDLSDLEAKMAAQGVLVPGVRGIDAVSAVMCVLAQRLNGGEAQDMVEALPKGLRPLIEGCVRFPPDQAEAFDRTEFLRRVAAHLHVTAPEAEAITRAVFTVVRPQLPPVEIDDVASQLPRDLKELWLGGLAATGPEARRPRT